VPEIDDRRGEIADGREATEMWRTGDVRERISSEPRGPETVRSERGTSGTVRNDGGAPAWNSLASRGGSLSLFSLLAAAGLGLMSLSAHLPRPDPETDSASGVGAGIIVRSEPRDLWIPRRLVELARRPSLSRSVRTHAEWRRFLEAEGLTDPWYAITARAYQAGGDSLDLTSIRWIHDDAPHFEEFRAILAAVSGREPPDPEPVFSKAAVHVLDEERSRHDPREVMDDLLRHRSPARDP
jgi:hypothetical protein